MTASVIKGTVVGGLILFVWSAISWMVLPWPHCGLGAWIAPTAVLLAHLAMNYDKAPTRKVIWVRWLTLLAAGAQSCLLMHHGLKDIQTLPW